MRPAIKQWNPLPWNLLGALAVISLSLGCGSSTPASPEAPGTSNTPPVADAGADLTVSATVPVSLDGTGSKDADGDSLTYAWSFASMPSGSHAAFDDAKAGKPSFTPDVAGKYIAKLVVNDGTNDSPADRVTVTARNNSASATISAANGGTVTSTDGKFSLDIPAGALGSDTQVQITMLLSDQYPDVLAGVDSDAVVYEMSPAGLTFSTPATVTVKEDYGVPDGATVGGSLGVVLTWSGAGLAVASNQTFEVDAGAQTTVLTAEVTSIPEAAAASAPAAGGLAADRAGEAAVGQGGFVVQSVDVQGGLGSVTVSADPPTTQQEGAIFPITVTVGIGDAGDAKQTDRSVSPVDTSAGFNGGFTLQQTGPTQNALQSKNSYECASGGDGTYGADVKLTIAVDGGTDTATAKLRSPIHCEAAPLPDFQELVADGAEDMVFGPDLLYVARNGGATAAAIDGEPVANLECSDLSSADVFTAFGDKDDGVMIGTSGGMCEFDGAVPETPSDPLPTLTLSALSAPVGGPDLTARTTDLVPFGNNSVAAVLFGSQQLAFFSSGTAAGGAAGFVLDQTLAGAWTDGNGQNVFGSDQPVSAYVGPNGFTANDPILVVTVASDGTSKLFEVDLVNGKAVLTEVTSVSLPDEVRQIRCLLGVCAVSAYGSGIGIGGMTYFLWDGQSTFTAVTGGSFTVQHPIGIDLIASGANSVFVAATDYDFSGNGNDLLLIDEISLDGSILSSVLNPVPTGCTGAGHVLFRGEVTDSHGQVIISCNLSGKVTQANF